MFLTLTSDLKTFSKFENSVAWSFSNLEFQSGDRIGLKEIGLKFSKPQINAHTSVSCNLVEKNLYNMNGLIYTAIFKRDRDIRQVYSSPSYWPIDVIRPRDIELTFSNVNTSHIDFISITIEIQNEQNRTL